MLPRATPWVPGAAPAGRASLKVPPTYTLLPMITWAQATPLCWTVGSPSAATVAGIPAPGVVSADPGRAPPTKPRETASAPLTRRATKDLRPRSVARTVRGAALKGTMRFSPPGCSLTRIAFSILEGFGRPGSHQGHHVRG